MKQISIEVPDGTILGHMTILTHLGARGEHKWYLATKSFNLQESEGASLVFELPEITEEMRMK